MSAKELKTFIELATSMAYTGDELKQFVAEERKKIDDRQDRESAHAHDLEKLRLDAGTKKEIEIDAQKAEAEKETERLRLDSETKKAEAAAQKETEKMKLEAQAERDRREF